ncbi:unnamed protein product [Callosobruchus maculatus]|uniref:Solute carrier family 25 member 38 homolog n=2 Tax=Callosobruchus maculatus TaxID=64391 RepID=A0A653CUK8_CALMS|nr:unnamed protein product [Callosobruchus maculatus]
MDSEHPILKAFLAGSFSGTFSTILFQPLDLVKTRLQNTTSTVISRHGTVSMVSTFANILQQEHISGLWRGMVPSLTRCVPGVGLYFCFLDTMKSQYLHNRAPSALESVAMGVTARCLSSAVLIPVTVVKTRVESGVYSYNGVLSALREIYRIEGVKGMTCGLLPTLFRDAPFSGLYLMFYTQTKSIIPRVIAGVLASVVTQPADVLKTKMQLYPNKFNGLWAVAVYVNAEHGMKGYFKGLVPRMLRRTLMAAMAWTIYERVSMKIGLK